MFIVDKWDHSLESANIIKSISFTLASRTVEGLPKLSTVRVPIGYPRTSELVSCGQSYMAVIFTPIIDASTRQRPFCAASTRFVLSEKCV